ncbi:MAG: hypothetical protein AB7V26_05875 [Lysobacterales bacterium]
MEVLLITFDDLMDAEIFAGLLRDHGVPARIENSHTLAVNWLWGPALGFFKIMVPKAQLLSARGLHSRWQQGEFALDHHPGDERPATLGDD